MINNYKQIIELRSITGSGILDCKQILNKVNGNMEKALLLLRQKGITKATKKINRKTCNGVICYDINHNKASIIKLTCETDFVAKNHIFIKLANQIASLLCKYENNSIHKFLDYKTKSNVTISNLIKQHISILGENISLKEIGFLSTSKGVIIPYVHNKFNDKTGTIIVLVVLEGEISDKVANFGKFLAMHIADSKPLVLSIEKLDNNLISKEKNMLTLQLKQLEQSKDIVEKTLKEKMKNFFSEIVLMEQPFIINKKKTIKSVIQELNRDCNFSLKEYIYLEIKK